MQEDPLVSDVWLLIVSHLSRMDLNTLSRLSHHFLKLFRPWLYRKLDLHLDRDEAVTTLELMYWNEELAKQVECFTLHAPSLPESDMDTGPDANSGITQQSRPRSLRPWIHSLLLAALRKMKSVQSIEMIGSIFSDLYQENDFLETLKRYGIPLSRLSFKHQHSFSGLVDLTENFGSGMVALTDFTWDVGTEGNSEHVKELMKPVWGILENSKDTLQRLSIPSYIRWGMAHTPLWSYRFSRLRSLNLGPWTSVGQYYNFTIFLLAHDKSLEELDFSHIDSTGRRISDASFFPFSPVSLLRLDSGSLPLLKSFRGNLRTFLRIQIIGLRSLYTSIESIDLTFGEYSTEVGLLRSAFNPFGRLYIPPNSHFTSLKYLRLTLIDIPEEGMIDQYTRHAVGVLCWFIESCPDSLEVLKLQANVPLDAIDLSDFLVCPKILRTIYLSIIIPCGNGEYIKELAHYCGSLREVWIPFERDAMGKEKGNWYRVRRGDNQKVLGIHKEIETKINSF